jgi:CheY-like chemotaxis protein
MSAHSRADASRGEIRILLVDDDELTRLSLTEVLRELGYQTTAAATGSAALAYLRAGVPVDVLITDIGLPDIMGNQLANEARALRPDVRIIFATGYDERHVKRAICPHASYLAKPFAREALASAIAGALAQEVPR